MKIALLRLAFLGMLPTLALAAAFAVAPKISLPRAQNCGGTQLPTCVPTQRERPTKTPTIPKQPTATRTPTPTLTLQPTPSPTQTNFLASLTPSQTPTPVTQVQNVPIRGFQQVFNWLSTPVFRFKTQLKLVPSPTPLPSVDLVIDNAEITQAIQCLNNPDCADNSVPMYTDKATMVRAYVRIFTGPTSVKNISGAICLGDTGEEGCRDPLRPIGPITVYKMSDAVFIWRRPGSAQRKLEGTLNFIIPASWVSSPGPLKFTVYVNYKEENIDETVYDTNNWWTVSSTVKKSAKLNVVFVQLSKYLVPLDSRWELVSYLRKTYPTGDIGVWSLPVWLAREYSFWDSSGSGCGPGWGQLLDDLEWWTKSYPQHYYGMVHSSAITRFDFAEGKIYNGYSGCGRRIGDYHREAGGIITPGSSVGGEIAAQEIGHNEGRMHAPGCGAGAPDPSSSGFLNEYGVDVLLRKGYSEPDREFMGYCDSGNKWVSLYTYRALASLWYAANPSSHVASAPPAVDNAEFLIGSGEISPDTVKIQDGFYRLNLANQTAENQQAGSYSVELQDRSGKVLFTRNFNPSEDSNHEPMGSGHFFLVLPWLDGTKTIVFKYQGVEIGRREASPNAPVVNLLLPNGNQAFDHDGPLTVNWEGSDADGDTLQYMLEYSRDGGTTWITVSPGLRETELMLDTSLFPGSDDALFQVIASDGFNTSVAVSSAPLSIYRKQPQVHIDAGTNDISIQESQPIVLLAMGTDLEDGPIESDQYQWSSNLDGDLGHGDLFTSQTLSIGQHVVTLAVTDSDRMTGTDTINVNVQPNAAIQTGPSITRLELFGLVLIVGTMGVVVILVFYKRRRPALHRK